MEGRKFIRPARSPGPLSGSTPAGIKPMLCTLLAEPFQDPEYLYEIKWDGYRIIAYKSAEGVRLSSRGGHDYTDKYPSVASALSELPDDFVFDGEVLVLNAEGKPDFDALQRVNGQRDNVYYYVFDLLWKNGESTLKLPLEERKTLLKDTLGSNPVVRYSEHVDDGLSLFARVESEGLEGIVAKHRRSVYVPDKRGRDWYKIPSIKKQEFVIGGWIESTRGRLFRTLLFGLYENGKLRWIGHAGGGFRQHEMPHIHRRLKAIETDVSPFVNDVDYTGVVHWVQPVLVANIKFATTTRAGKIRKPAIFLGFREDKDAAQVTADKAGKHFIAAIKDARHVASEGNWPLLAAEKVRNKSVIDIEGCSFEVHNVDRDLWKGITKGDLLAYYAQISSFMLPHLRDRPLSLYVKLKGPNAPGVYIKDMEGRQPSWARVFSTERKHARGGKRDVIDYLVCNNTATLLYTINLGCVDVNPWTSRTTAASEPDYVIIDLDPSDEDFAKAVEVAICVREILDEAGLKSFPKTSGKTGLHIYIPCRGFSHGETRGIAQKICDEVEHRMPFLATTALATTDRNGKVFVDANQNDYTDTVAAPYSARPAKHPFVSTPLDWKEVNRGLDHTKFTISSIGARLKKKGDLFSRVLDERIALNNSKVLRWLS